MAPESQSGPPGPRDDESGDTVLPAFAKQHPDHQISSYRHSSRQVAWWEVHSYRERMLECLGVQSFPMVGSPAWCDLDDNHPAKLAAVCDAAQHWALRLDTAQHARAAASQAISAGADWTALGRETQQRAEFYAINPWARRVIV